MYPKKAMLAAKPLVVDWKREDVQKSGIFPHLPLLSSKHLGWNGIHLEYHHQPAHKTPEHCYAQHVISIHRERPVTVEQIGNGRFQRKHLVHGDITIYPAGQGQSVRWDRETNFIDLYLETEFLERAASELSSTSHIEIIPQLKVTDPLIHQIALALKTELSSDALGSRLYAESMATALAVHLLRRYSVRSQIIRDYTDGLPKYKLQQAIDYINFHPRIKINATSSNVWALALGTSAIACNLCSMGGFAHYLSNNTASTGCLHSDLVSLFSCFWGTCGLPRRTAATS